LTATATPEVRRDIADALELRDPKVFVAGFDRPNLFIEVLRASGDKDKLGRIVALARGGGPGLVYAATRKNVEKVVAALRASGVDANGHHAGMEDGEGLERRPRDPRRQVGGARARLRRRGAGAVRRRPPAGERRPPRARAGARRPLLRRDPVGDRRRPGRRLRAPRTPRRTGAADAG